MQKKVSDFESQNFYKNNLHLLLGQELGKKDKIKQSIVKNIKIKLEKKHGDKTDSYLSTSKFFLGDDSLACVSSEILETSLFSKYKIIILNQVERLSSAEAKKISEVLKKISQEVFVILLSEENKVSNYIEKIVEKKNKKIFWKLTESDYEDYIRNYLLSAHIDMDTETIDLIIHLAGEHTSELDNLLHSITLYLRHQHKPKQDNPNTPLPVMKVSKENIESWISHYKHESIFSLFTMLSNYRFEKAFTILASLLSSGESPITYIGGLVYQLRIALKVKKGLENCMTPDRIFSLLNIRSYTQQQQYRNFVQTIPSKAIETMLCICEDTDSTIRSGFETRYHQIICSKMLYNIACLMRKN